MFDRIFTAVLVVASLILALPVTQAGAQENRRIETTPDSDYFGFDLRTELNVTLQQCESACLADRECRAFTYNSRVNRCFIKSDFATIQPSPGAVAGRVVSDAAEADLGAPERLTFLPADVVDSARRQRDERTEAEAGTAGLDELRQSAEQAFANGDLPLAITTWSDALAISQDDPALWMGLANANLSLAANNNGDRQTYLESGTAAALNAYQASRSLESRADALATLGQALDQRNIDRPAIQAFEASLALRSSPEVESAYLDVRARKGFRIVDHSVDAETLTPRVCAQFSEDLAKSGVDYATFVTLDGRAAPAVEASDRQICVDGLEHGKQYRVTFRQGLPAAIGEQIASPVTLEIYVRDRQPSARFTGDAFVLPSAGRHGIPLTTVNMEKADLELYRIGDRALTQLLSGSQFLRQLDGYDIATVQNDLGIPVWKGTIDVANRLNEETVSAFPVDEALPERKPGVYVLTARPVDDRSETWTGRATQWFVVSDIGLSTWTGDDGLTVFARSLNSAKPLGNVELTLLARNNEELGRTTTDAEGRAHFAPGLVRGGEGLYPAVLMASGAGDDFVFLDMARGGFDLSDRGVTGRAAPGALDVFAWTERGIYRAGETIHAAALARDPQAKAVRDLPLTFIFSRPDGVEDRGIVATDAGLGSYAVDYATQPNAMRGTWQIRIHTDPEQPAVATQSVLVEDFVPDRIEFDLAADPAEITVGQTAAINVDGRFLYGAPAAGLAIEGETVLKTTRDWARFPAYQFGLADEEIEEQGLVQPLEDLPLLDDEGHVTFEVGVDMPPSTTQLLSQEVVVRMREGAGRAVERRTTLAVQPQTAMIGLRLDGGESVPEGSTARVNILAANADGTRRALPGAIWRLVKLERDYQWYRRDNSWNYEPVTRTVKVAEGRVDIAAGTDAIVANPVEWGRYRFEVETSNANGPASSLEFEAGWYVESASTETPDALEIALDKESYAVGDVARVQVTPRFAGEALITVGADALVATQVATIPAGGATIEVPVTEGFGTGAYVTATLFRPGEGAESRMPARAIGIKWLGVDPGQRRLAVELDAPDQVLPRGPLSVPISVPNAVGQEAYVTLAAVDVGILNLTRYEAPDPAGWYFGQRGLGLEIRDLYGRLIDGSLGAFGRIRTGGDGGNVATQGSPPTEKLVAFFSGPVKLDDQGRAEITFDIPQFNGTARLMAVAWTEDAVGQGTQDVIVRDPVVVTAGKPRFLATGDAAELRLDIANTDGPGGDWTLAVTGSDPVSIGQFETTLALAEDARQAVIVPIEARETGDGRIDIRLTHPSGVTVEQALALPVRPPNAPVTNRNVVALAPGASLTVDRELLAGSLLDGATVSVGVTRSAALDVASLVMTLDRYPYGCAEQTVSRALPLLYLSDLAAQAGMEDDPALGGRIKDAIAQVLAYQSSSGSFGLWSPGSGDLWLDSYVTDFLTRAGEQGYEVPAESLRIAIQNLGNAVAYANDLTGRDREIAYALYVMARNKKASVGDLRYYVDTQIEAFTTPMARAQLGAALALYGDAERSTAAFRSAYRLASGTDAADLSRADYGTPLRDGAAMLALAAETRPAADLVEGMIELVSSERNNQAYTSTQEEAWLALAARAVAGPESIKLDVDGMGRDGPFSRRVAGADLEAQPITLTNRGTTPVDAVVTAVAPPAEPLPAGGSGFSITRTYYDLEGNEVNATEAAQNDRLVAVLTMTEENAWPSRVLVTDWLPAGFEIDNPSIVGSAELENFSWLEKPEPARVEFRDDRFVAAFDRNADSPREFSVAYVVRAVTPGVYAHPAASVEDMYRPQYSARTASGLLDVQAN